MTRAAPFTDAIVALAKAEPHLTRREIAERVGCAIESVGPLLNKRGLSIWELRKKAGLLPKADRALAMAEANPRLTARQIAAAVGSTGSSVFNLLHHRGAPLKTIREEQGIPVWSSGLVADPASMRAKLTPEYETVLADMAVKAGVSRKAMIIAILNDAIAEEIERREQRDKAA